MCMGHPVGLCQYTVSALVACSLAHRIDQVFPDLGPDWIYITRQTLDSI